MKVALVNPCWSFAGDRYFGCRQPQLPREYGYSKALLEASGHEVIIADAQKSGLQLRDLRVRLLAFRPTLVVITTAPSYLLRRQAPPELHGPLAAVEAIRDISPVLVVVGPHASTIPRATLQTLRVDYAIVGECEVVLVELANCAPGAELPSGVVWLDGQGGLQGHVETHVSAERLAALR